MNPPKGEETIFAEALDLPPAERAAYLAQATAGNPALRRRIESLLGSHRAGDFLEQAAAVELRPTLHLTVPVTEKPGETIGRYKLLQQIGEGGCGVVYMAEQSEPVRRRVALKIIKLGMDTKSVIARFEAERQALALMDHPNIAKVFDAGATEAGRPYFVMELVRGMKITEFCDEKKLSTRARLDLFIQVCQAIQHAHQKGIIHRDIKPSNILVTVNDGVPVPKVIDFGIAKATAGQQLTDKTLFTAFEQFVGTPAYMSPEQATLTSLDIDTRSDIYALGVLLYELLTGRTPFDAKELLAIGFDEMRRTIREQEPQRPSTRLSTLSDPELSTTAQRRGLDAPQLVSELRGDLDWIVMKAMEKDRARRYETANGLAADIQRHLDDEPVLASPPSTIYRLQKAIRRNKAAFVTAAFVSTALIFGTVLAVWQARRARQAEVAANAERDSAEAVLQFFRDNVLAAARPAGLAGGLGKDVPLRQAIDTAEAKIAKTFQNRPLVEAAIRKTLGESYAIAGNPAAAVRQLERALALRQEFLGRDHDGTVRTMHLLADAYRRAGQLGHASSLHEQTLKLRMARFGPGHSDILSSMNSLALVYQEQGRLQEALPLFEEVVRLRRSKFPSHASDTLISIDNLADAYREAGRVQEAVLLQEETLKRTETQSGAKHVDTFNRKNNLALTYAEMGRLEQALLLHEEAVQGTEAVLGVNHPMTLRCMNNLALAYTKTARRSDGLRLFEKTLKLSQTCLGPEHPDSLLVQYNLGIALWDSGNRDQAVKLYEQVLAGRKAVLGAEHTETLLIVRELAKAYRETGRLDEALMLFREVLGLNRAQRSPHDLETLLTLEGLAKTLSVKADAIRHSRPEESRELVSEALKLLTEQASLARAKYSNDALVLAQRLYSSAEFHYRQGNYQQAESLYREIIDLRRSRLAVDHKDILEPSASLARLLSDWAWAERGNPTSEMADRAREAEMRLRAVLAARVRDDTNSWRIGDLKSRLGAALVSVAMVDPTLDPQGRTDKMTVAESLLLEGYECLRNHSSVEKYRRDAVQRLVRLYEAGNMADQRAAWQKKLAWLDKGQQKSSSPEKMPNETK